MKQKIQIITQAITFSQDGYIIADIPSLELCVHAKTEKNLKKVIHDSIYLFVEHWHKIGQFDRKMKSLGFKKHVSKRKYETKNIPDNTPVPYNLLKSGKYKEELLSVTA